jgi:hypothetical protein
MYEELMPRPLARALPLVLGIAVATVFFVAILPGGGGPTVGTDPPALAVIQDGATPIEVVTGFADSLNAGDVERSLGHLDPGVATVFLPGVAGLAEPSVAEVRAALDQYQVLGQTISIERCDESSAPLEVRTDLRILSAGAAGGTVLDCWVVYASSFARRIGIEEETRLFMRFDVGANGIAAMHLSPVVLVGE